MSFLRNQNTVQMATTAAQLIARRGYSGLARSKLTANKAIPVRGGGHHGPQVPGEVSVYIIFGNKSGFVCIKIITDFLLISHRLIELCKILRLYIMIAFHICVVSLNMIIISQPVI